MGFEEYLINKGYTKMVYNFKTEKLTSLVGSSILSSMGTLEYIYVKQGYKNIIYGLNEAYKPPVLIYPKPMSLINLYRKNVHAGVRDDDVHNVFNKHTLDEIYESILK